MRLEREAPLSCYCPSSARKWRVLKSGSPTLNRRAMTDSAEKSVVMIVDDEEMMKRSRDEEMKR